MTLVKIAGREIPLVFNVDSWAEMEKDVCILARVNDVLGYHGGNDVTSDSLEKLVSMVRILGNQGLEIDEKDRDLSDKWLRKNIRPAAMLKLKLAVIEEIDKGMQMEANEQKEGAERDLVLEEINQKKTPSD